MMIGDEARQAKHIALAQKAFSSVIVLCSKIIVFANQSNPASIFLAMLSDMLVYLRYLEIYYPTRLQQVLDQNDGFGIDIIPDIPCANRKCVSELSSAKKFKEYEFPSSFIVNFWGTGITLLSLVVAFALILAMQVLFKSCKLPSLVIRKIRASMQWSFMLMNFVSSYGEIVVFSALEFRSRPFSQGWRGLSFTAGVLTNMLSIFVFVKMIKIINKVQKARIRAGVSPQTPQGHLSPHQKWKDCEVLFETFNQGSLLQQMFFPIFITRLYIFYLVISYLESCPLAQMIIICVLNSTIVIYILVVRPHRTKVDTLECIVPEIVLLVVNLCVLSLAILDKANMEAKTARESLGEAVIWINTAFYAGGAIYLLVRIVSKIIQMIKTRRNRLADLSGNIRSLARTTARDPNLSQIASSDNSLAVTKVNIQSGNNQSHSRSIPIDDSNSYFSYPQQNKSILFEEPTHNDGGPLNERHTSKQKKKKKKNNLTNKGETINEVTQEERNIQPNQRRNLRLKGRKALNNVRGMNDPNNAVF